MTAPLNALRIGRVGPRTRLGALALAGTVAFTPVLAVAAASPAWRSYADLVEKVSPAVVQITAKHDMKMSSWMQDPEGGMPEQFREGPFGDFLERFFRDRMPNGPQQPMPERHAAGSGFIVDDDGFVVTNAHVVGTGEDVIVTLKDGRKFDAELVGADEKTDLAVLRIGSDGQLPEVRWGDSDSVRVGDPVLAVGNPFGLGGSVTAGIVSARGREIGSGPYDDFIQVDAPINRGNSGGPLFNAEGEVIGVNTAIFSPNGGNVGIGFAIPSELARTVVAELRESGRVERGWLGVSIQPVTDEIAESLGMDTAQGALIASVNPDSPAEAGGLRQGDVILGFGDTEIEDLRDLTRAVAGTKAGTEASVKLWRGEDEVDLSVKIGKAPTKVAMAGTGQADRDGVELDELGITLATLDDRTRERFGLESDAQGVLVTAVERGSAAADKGLRPGDLITVINQKPVTEPAEIASEVEQAERAERKAVLVLVERQGERRFVALELAEA